MVDYNLQVPGIAPAQSLQINPLQMLPMLQQQQLNNMLIQERARELQETNALRQYLRDPNRDLTTQPGMLGALSVAPKAAAPVISAVSTAMRELRQGETSRAQTAQTRLETLGRTVEFGRKSLAAVDPNDKEGYRQWFTVMGPYAKQLGYNLPPPDKWNAQAKTNLLTTIETFNEQLKEARAPVDVEYVPGPDGTLQARPKKLAPGTVPMQIPVGQAPPGAGVPVAAPFVGNPAAGVPSYPVPPNRMADINRRSALYGGVPAQIAPAGEPPNALVQSDTFRAQQPSLPRSPTGEKFTTRADFTPARTTPTAVEAGQRKTGELTATRKAMQPKAMSAMKATTDAIENQLNTIDTLLAHPGFSKIFGPVAGRTPDTSKEATAARDLLQRVGSESVLSGLTALRAASPTGASGFGSLTEKEGERLERIGTPAATVYPEDAKKVLLERKKELERLKARTSESFRLEYPDADASVSAAPPKAGGVINWNDLAPGKR